MIKSMWKFASSSFSKSNGQILRPPSALGSGKSCCTFSIDSMSEEKQSKTSQMLLPITIIKLGYQILSKIGTFPVNKDIN